MGAKRDYIERFWEKVDRRGPDECWEWTATRTRGGYGHLGLSGKLVMAHRISWQAHNGPIPPGMFVCHRCDVPGCCNPAHLFLGTHSDNMRDREEKGRGVAPPPMKGEEHPGAKLTEADVISIRLAVAAGRMHKDVAREFGVTRSLVSFVVNRKRWRHVK